MKRWTPPSKERQTVESKQFFSPTPDDLVGAITIQSTLNTLTAQRTAHADLRLPLPQCVHRHSKGVYARFSRQTCGR